MLDLKLFQNNPKEIKEKLLLRGVKEEVITEINKLAQKRSKIMTQLQTLEAKRNKLSKEVGYLKIKNKSIDSLIQEVAFLKKIIEQVKKEEININQKIIKEIMQLPNLYLDDTPKGKSEVDNIVIDEQIIGRKKVTNIIPHYEIGVKLGIVDFERTVKMSGARYWSYKGQGAKLVRALENFMLDQHIARGYEEIRPPVILKEEMFKNSGHLPKFEKDLFKIDKQNSYLIPTAETVLINYHHNQIIDLTKPKSYTAFTSCFRKEAGAGGKDMRGLIRGHQFNKVELVKFCQAKDLNQSFTNMISDVAHILNLLAIPYRQIRLCIGDLGFAAEKTIDFEIWIPSEKKYREVSSVSSTGNFQGRRAKIRYRENNKETKYAYALNGSGLAIDRVVAAILENYQNSDGTITIPEPLVKYMGIKIIK